MQEPIKSVLQVPACAGKTVLLFPVAMPPPQESSTQPHLLDDLRRAVLLSPNVILFAADANGILTYTDGGGLAGFGVKPGDGIGQHLAEFFNYSSSARAGIAKVFKGETQLNTMLIGGRYLRRHIVPAFGSDGKVVGLVGFSTDITDQHAAEEELVAQKELLNNLFDSIPDNTYVLDRNFNVLLANKAARDMFSTLDLIGPACFRSVHAIEGPCTFCPVVETYQTGLPAYREYFDEKFQGHFELTSFPIRDRQGNIIGATETARDITEKKRMEETLQKNEAFLQDLFSSISDGIFVIDRHYTISRTNRTMDEMYTEHLPLVGKKCYVTSLLDEICPNCPAEKMFAIGKPVTIEHYEQPTDDKPGMWLDHTAYPIFGEKNEITGAISIIRDITDRKSTEFELSEYRTKLENLVEQRTQELQLSEAKLRSILENSSAAISFADWRGNFTYINKTYQEMFGYSENDLYGTPVWSFVDPNHVNGQDSARNALDGIFDQHRLTLPLRAKDGRIIWSDISISTVRGSRPDETQLISVIVDVTERQQILEELNRAKTAAEDASQAKSQFLATMSHEIRTPLNGVIGLSDLLLATPMLPKQLEYAKLIKASGNSLLFLINDILDFSKIEAGKFELENLEFNLPEIVESVMGILAAKANDQNLELAVTFGPKVPRQVFGDGGRLRQILLNLVGNGLKFTQHGGVRIHVSNETLRNNGVNIRFEVIDTGIGIPEERLHRLFKPFSQVDASSARLYGGTGLGLAICKKLVELMRGSIGVQSVEGKGSTFWLSIPFECQPEILECMRLPTPLCVERQATICQRTEASFCPGSGHRVGLDLMALTHLPALIVSGNETQRQAIRTQFNIWGLAAESVSNGGEAWERFQAACHRNAPYRLIVVDIVLQDGPGTMLIDHILHDERSEKPAVIALIPLSAESTNDFHRENGVQYLSKPVYCSALFNALTSFFMERISPSSTTPGDELAEMSSLPERSSREPIRVLIAEDNRINQIVIVEILNNAGMQSIVVSNGQEACNAVKAGTFDIVLMDCQMPKMDGYQATIEIRNWERSRLDAVDRLPIIALTANATKGDEEKCLQAGMDAYCSKPIDPKQIVNMIMQWVAKKNDVQP